VSTNSLLLKKTAAAEVEVLFLFLFLLLILPPLLFLLLLLLLRLLLLCLVCNGCGNNAEDLIVQLTGSVIPPIHIPAAPGLQAAECGWQAEQCESSKLPTTMIMHQKQNLRNSSVWREMAET
jgi:hypothetical protein